MSSVPSTFFHTQEQYDLRFEAARRSTFLYWPRSFSIPPATLAAAGFFYTGISDTVKCFACAVEISNWSDSRTPMQLHEIYCPSCRFVCNEDCGNVPIEGRSRLRPNCITKLKNLKYANYECRLDSFATFPNTHMSREQLADAGFYYDGRNDMAICHHCSIGIENWNPGEDPWVRHAISSPACCYIIEARGCEYINNVTGQDLYSNSIQEATETTDENHEGSDSLPEEKDQRQKHLTQKEKLSKAKSDIGSSSFLSRSKQCCGNNC
ncbi:E3 ubiquitin-protein ligase XIAP-like [Bombus fervidus]|uniref:E3 ubiquitin-protein ligase XIAP-like n=1 Tax=Bombus fervidus TaxID=203811 RepID=UPI003AB14F8D